VARIGAASGACEKTPTFLPIRSQSAGVSVLPSNRTPVPRSPQGGGTRRVLTSLREILSTLSVVPREGPSRSVPLLGGRHVLRVSRALACIPHGAGSVVQVK